MEFFILIVLNIFIGAVLYLVISLKLEKSASEFREKKLRKEMDDIIKDFNSTAERNISILENRINILKKLLEISGDLKTLDITLNDDDKAATDSETIIMENETIVENKTDSLSTEKIENSNDIADKQRDFETINHRSDLRLLLKRFTDKLSKKKGIISKKYKKNERDDIDTEKKNIEKSLPVKKIKSEKSIDITVDEDLTQIDNFNNNSDKSIINDKLSKDEILEMFASTDDKYSIISTLFSKGYTLDDIAKYSGIPTGEIKLVLNLNSTT